MRIALSLFVIPFILLGFVVGLVYHAMATGVRAALAVLEEYS
jgi:hypothetical protein